MSLEDDLATATDTTTVFLDAERRRGELRADLTAIGAAFTTRPSILRRAAALLAEELPTATDRLVTTGTADAVAVTTALALHTGLPFAVDAGEVHRGDRVAVVTPIADDPAETSADATAAALADRVRAAGAEPVVVLSVLAADGTPTLAGTRTPSENLS
ncbi:hypothetical protein AB0383_05645 [Amycolatopsis sp. NPDC051373]|uniref:hypothetical protein n=1 Tax=Amycolatopsis sp. NPDC051373 TaxID=3155801 RepID=UPI00344E7536